MNLYSSQEHCGDVEWMLIYHDINCTRYCKCTMFLTCCANSCANVHTANTTLNRFLPDWTNCALPSLTSIRCGTEPFASSRSLRTTYSCCNLSTMVTWRPLSVSRFELCRRSWPSHARLTRASSKVTMLNMVYV